jgi:polar amino acid transport system substrate-binding protein
MKSRFPKLTVAVFLFPGTALAVEAQDLGTLTVARAAGVEVTFIRVPWDGIFSGLQAGRYDAVISGLTVTEERRRVMDFSIPYSRDDEVVLIRTEGKDVASVADLAGRTVGVLAGSVGESELNRIKDTNDVRVKNCGEDTGYAFRDLAEGTIDAFYCDAYWAENTMRNGDPALKGKIKLASAAVSPEAHGITVGNGKVAILAAINQALLKVLGSAEYSETVARWFE